MERGLRPGDAISFVLPNWHEATVIYLAATLAGLVVHPVVPDLPDNELAFMLTDISSRMLFVPASLYGVDYLDRVRHIVSDLIDPPQVVVVRGDAQEFLPYIALAALRPDLPLPHVDPDSVKLVLYTSGTTGRPKGILHSHNSLNALVTQLRNHWRSMPGDRFFVPSSVGHIGGSIYAFEFPFLFGTTAVLQDVWDAQAAIAIVAREECTHMAGAPPFLAQFLAAMRTQGVTLPRLSTVICGGGSVSPSLIREAQAMLPGCSISRVFGTTEVPAITVGATTPEDADRGAETDGRIGIATIKLLDPHGHPTREGEVLVRGPQMLVGYLWAIDERQAFDAEGYVRTGDFARLEADDWLVVTAGRQDIVTRDTVQIAPKEVEDILVQHPDILDAALIGLPSGSGGVIWSESSSAHRCASRCWNSATGPLCTDPAWVCCEIACIMEPCVLRITAPMMWH